MTVELLGDASVLGSSPSSGMLMNFILDGEVIVMRFAKRYKGRCESA
jgi:hypothetical protein